MASLPFARASWVRWVPHVLTISRFAIVGLMVSATLKGDRAVYVVALLAAVLTDMFDGSIARAAGLESSVGANLDSASDLAFYLAVAFCSYLWAPHVLAPLLWLVGLFLAGYVGTLLLSKKYRGVIGFHNRWSRGSATTGVVAGIWLVVFVDTAWVAIAVLILITAADLTYRYRHIWRTAAAQRRMAPGTP